MTTIRAEIPEKYKWDFSTIYPDSAAFEADFAKVEQLIGSFKAHEVDMLCSPETLLATLDDYFAGSRIIEKLYE